MEIKGKLAVVVGGASGMGRASAELLAERGAQVAIIDRPGGAGEEVATAIGGVFFEGDITDHWGIEAQLAQAVTSLGGLHIAVNTAGGGIVGKTLGKDGPHALDAFTSVINLNLISTFNLNRLQAAHMAQSEPNEDGERGVIINTSSIAAFEGQIGQVAYSAAKAGIAGMALTMARDLGSYTSGCWRSRRACSTPVRSPGCLRTWSVHSSPATPSPSGWDSPRSTPSSPSRSPRTPCSTASACDSTPACASPRADP